MVILEDKWARLLIPCSPRADHAYGQSYLDSVVRYRVRLHGMNHSRVEAAPLSIRKSARWVGIPCLVTFVRSEGTLYARIEPATAVPLVAATTPDQDPMEVTQTMH
jgi:hypothetical protein